MPTKKPSILRKIKSVPLTTSEKVLLVLLAIAIILYVGNRFILIPQAASINDLENQKVDMSMRINEMNATLRREPEIKKAFEELEIERNQILNNYFPTLDQSQIIYLLNDMLPMEEVEISNLDFSRPVTESLNQIDVRNMAISLPFNGPYSEVLKLVKSIESSPRRMMVDSITLDRESDDLMAGSMNLKVYSLEGLAETDPNVIFVQIPYNSNEKTLFNSFENFDMMSSSINGSVVTPGTTDGSVGTGIGDEPSEPEPIRGDIINNFEQRDYDFIPSHEFVKGTATPTTIKTSGRFGLRFEYNIYGVELENRAYVDLTNKNMEFTIPPQYIYINIYSFSYNPGTLGARFVTANGDILHTRISDGIDWLGWARGEIEIPRDLSLYPLKLTHLYYGTEYNQDDFGVLIFDDMEVLYPHHYEEEVDVISPNMFFYEVQPGESISSISVKFYGSERYKDEILKNNELKAQDVLPVGKILVMAKR